MGINIDRLCKIMELRDHGATDGERAAAQGRLDALLVKFGITEDALRAEIASQTSAPYGFNYSCLFEKDLLFQLAYMLIPEWDGAYCTVCGKRAVKFMLTVDLWIDMSEAYAIYRKALRDEMHTLFTAFINRHGICSPDAKTMTPTDTEDLARQERVLRMAKSLQGLERPGRKITYQEALL